MWKLLKIFLFIFLLLWFLFHQDFFHVEIKQGKRNESPPQKTLDELGDYLILYRVRPGETLSEIASRIGVEQEHLIMINRISNPHLLRAGQRLMIPKSPSDDVVQRIR